MTFFILSVPREHRASALLLFTSCIQGQAYSIDTKSTVSIWELQLLTFKQQPKHKQSNIYFYLTWDTWQNFNSIDVIAAVFSFKAQSITEAGALTRNNFTVCWRIGERLTARSLAALQLHQFIQTRSPFCLNCNLIHVYWDNGKQCIHLFITQSAHIIRHQIS